MPLHRDKAPIDSQRANSFASAEEHAARKPATTTQDALFVFAADESGLLSLKYTLLAILIALAFFYLAGNFELAVIGVFSDVTSRLTL